MRDCTFAKRCFFLSGGQSKVLWDREGLWRPRASHESWSVQLLHRSSDRNLVGKQGQTVANPMGQSHVEMAPECLLATKTDLILIYRAGKFSINSRDSAMRDGNIQDTPK